MTLIKLDHTHKEKILDFWDSKRDINGTVFPVDPQRNRKKFEHVFEAQKDKYTIYAIFNDQQDIVFTLGSVLWENLPYYSIIDFYVAQEVRSENQVMKYMAKAINQILADRLKIKRHTFYYLFKRSHVREDVEWSSEYTNSYSKYISESNKYNYSTEDIVMPGEKPSYLTYWRLMGERTYNVELLIRKGTLKPMYMEALFRR